MVQMYEPLYGALVDKELRPATIYIHGGGWLGGDHGKCLDMCNIP